MPDAAPATTSGIHRRGKQQAVRVGRIVGAGRYVLRMKDHPTEFYRWLDGSRIDAAATITVCTGASEAAVLRAFGARAGPPVPVRIAAEPCAGGSRYLVDPFVQVLRVAPDVVLALEDDVGEGARQPVLTRASAPGLAVSVSWSGDAGDGLVVARKGALLIDFDPWAGTAALDTGDPELLGAAEGLDFADADVAARRGALVVVERLTGFRFGPEHLAEIDARDAAHRILPWLDEHHPERRLADGSREWAGHGPLGADTDRLATLPGAVLAELAWSGARTVAERTGLLADEPAAEESLAACRLTPAAELLARESTLSDGEHFAGWDVLHKATNSDPPAAVIQVLEEVGRVLGERGLVAAREVVGSSG